jgi:hypothetical protein
VQMGGGGASYNRVVEVMGWVIKFRDAVCCFTVEPPGWYQ